MNLFRKQAFLHNLPQISPFLPKASVFRRNYPENTPKLPQTCPNSSPITPKLPQSARNHPQTSPNHSQTYPKCPNPPPNFPTVHETTPKLLASARHLPKLIAVLRHSRSQTASQDPPLAARRRPEHLRSVACSTGCDAPNMQLPPPMRTHAAHALQCRQRVLLVLFRMPT